LKAVKRAEERAQKAGGMSKAAGVMRTNGQNATKLPAHKCPMQFKLHAETLKFMENKSTASKSCGSEGCRKQRREMNEKKTFDSGKMVDFHQQLFYSRFGQSCRSWKGWLLIQIIQDMSMLKNLTPSIHWDVVEVVPSI